jgi:hypothetical protein
MGRGTVALSDFAQFVRWCNAPAGAFLGAYWRLLQDMHIGEVAQQPWFFGFLPRPRAKELLRGQPVGSFLVRCSSQPLCFALDLMQPSNEVHHILRASFRPVPVRTR